MREEGMIDTSERVEQFKADIAQLTVRDPATAREKQLLRLGALLMIGGVVAGVVAYFNSHATSNPAVQRDWVIVALTGVAAAVAGSALFLRYSLGTFLRVWLARLVYEQRARANTQEGDHT